MGAGQSNRAMKNSYFVFNFQPVRLFEIHRMFFKKYLKDGPSQLTGIFNVPFYT